MLREPRKVALRTYISDRRIVIVPGFVLQSLLLFLNPCFCPANSLICSDNMVYISPMHVTDTRPMFLRWCIVMRVWQLIRKCVSLKKTELTVINIKIDIMEKYMHLCVIAYIS